MKKLLISIIILTALCSYAQTPHVVHYTRNSSYNSFSVNGSFGSVSLPYGGTSGSFTGYVVVNGRPTTVSMNGTCGSTSSNIPTYGNAPYCYAGTGSTVFNCATSVNITVFPLMVITLIGTNSNSCKIKMTSRPGATDIYLRSWQYSFDMVNWVGMSRHQGSETVEVTLADIGGSGAVNANKDVWFRCHANACGQTSNEANPPAGPYKIVPDPPKFTESQIQKIAPSCFNKTNGKIIITDAALPRALNADEYVQAKYWDATSSYSESGISANLNANPLIINGPLELNSGTGTLEVISYYGAPPGQQLVTCTTVSQPITIPVTNDLTVTPNITSAILCPGGKAVVTVDATGSQPPLEYNIDGGTFQLSSVFSNVAAGSHTVQVRNTNDTACKKNATIIVADATPITITNASITKNISCTGFNNGEITIVVSAGSALQYSLNGAPYQTPNIFTALAPNDYTVTIKDANNCTKNANVLSMADPSPVSSTFISTDAICFGTNTGKINVSPSGGTGPYKFSKNAGLNFRTTSKFDSLAAGSYTIQIKDNNGCISNFPATIINQPVAISISTGVTPVTCFGGNNGTIDITAANGIGTLQYSIDNGGTFQAGKKFINLTAATYPIIVKDTNGCTTTKSQPVTSNAVITGSFNESSPVQCKSDSNGALDLTPAGGVGPYTYTWSHGPTTEDVSGLAAGDYSVTITDSKGCSKALTYTLTEPNLLTISSSTLSNYNGFNVKCLGSSNGTIDISVTGGSAAYSYNWSTNATSQDIGTLPAGPYNVIVTDSRGCTATKSFTLTSPTLHTTSVTNNKNISCADLSDGLITVTSTGGAGSYQFSKDSITWQPSNTFSALAAGPYTIQARDANLCPASVSITLTAPTALVISTTETNTECGKANGSSIATASGSTPAYTFKWYAGNNFLTTGSSISSLAAGVYQLDVTDQNGCLKQKNNITISSSNGPVITVTSTTTTTCYESMDGTALISITGGEPAYNILWRNSNGKIINPATGLGRGDYVVEVSDATSCIGFKTITIPSPDPINIETLVMQDPSCFDKNDGLIETLTQGGNGNLTYSWSNSTSSTSLQNVIAGTYILTATDLKGCNISKQFILNNPPRFLIDLGPDKEMCEGQLVTLKANEENAAFNWLLDENVIGTEPQMTVNKPGVYKLRAVTEKGCEAEDDIELIVNLKLLKTDFLVATEAHAGDSIAMIDISWPLPENITWEFDEKANIIQNGQDWAVIQFDDEGIYSVGMTAKLGACTGYFTQDIIIHKKAEGSDGGRIKSALITDYTVYPNPIAGQFSLSIHLREVHPVTIEMVNLSGNKIVFLEELSDKDLYERRYNLENLTSGVYFLIIKAGGETKTVRLVAL